jgi:hypothetical protein
MFLDLQQRIALQIQAMLKQAKKERENRRLDREKGVEIRLRKISNRRRIYVIVR